MREQLAKSPSRSMPSWAPADQGCWSDWELCEIDRIRAACEECAALDLEGGNSNEGDPWCIVYDRERKLVVLHIARSDRCYVVVGPCQARIHRTTYLTAAVETALRELNRAEFECSGNPTFTNG